MRYLILLLLAVASNATAYDVCPQYVKIHLREVAPRIKSGIPFKLLGVAHDGEQSFRKIIRVEYDLWTERVEVENIGGKTTVAPLSTVDLIICRELSFEGGRTRRPLRYQILLNPDLTDGLARLKSRSSGKSGLLGINWSRLARDLDSEKVLLEGELAP